MNTPSHQIFARHTSKKFLELFIFSIKIPQKEIDTFLDIERKDFARYEIATTDYLLSQQQQSLNNKSAKNSMGGKLPFLQINEVNLHEFDAIMSSKEIYKEKFFS